MNNKLIKLLLYIAVGLCVVIAMEWLYASYSRHQLLTSASPAKAQDYKADQLPGMELSKQPEESYGDLVARPLFIKGRRAVDEPVRAEIEQGGAKPESFDWQLSGVYGTKNTVSALFSRVKTKLGKDNFRKIAVGEELDGWKLVEINRDRAVLRQGTKEKELLLRKSKPKNPPQQAVQPAPPAPAPVASPEPAEENTKDTSESSQ